jgi:hypothetical protein
MMGQTGKKTITYGQLGFGLCKLTGTINLVLFWSHIIFFRGNFCKRILTYFTTGKIGIAVVPLNKQIINKKTFSRDLVEPPFNYSFTINDKVSSIKKTICRIILTALHTTNKTASKLILCTLKNIPKQIFRVYNRCMFFLEHLFAFKATIGIEKVIRKFSKVRIFECSLEKCV